MKRLIAILLSCAFLLGACSSGSADTTGSTAAESTAAEAAVDTDADSELRYVVEWAKDAVIYEVNIRQYTEEGTFNAFAEHLQELKDMGITTLWFMPIHPISETNRSGELGSYYSVTDYRAVNPEFGTEEDFAALVEQAHEMGFTVMMDWVANHTGWDCAWITEHPDWYTQDEDGNIISPEGMGWPDVADLNYDNEEMRQEMIACMKYWVENYDIDGFRCDYATGVPVDFWEEARAELETVKPLLMLAEDGSTLSLLNEAFDMNYNWSLYDAILDVANGGKKATRLKYYIPSNYPDGTFALNFLDNHDKNSYEHTIIGAVGEDGINAMFTLIYTIPGIPLVYSGDEVGLDHAIAFMSKDTIDWDTGRDYRELLTALAQIRTENPALYAGNYGGEISYFDTGSDYVLAYSRTKDDNTVICILNLNKNAQSVDLTGLVSGEESVLLHGVGSGEAEIAPEDADLSGMTGAAELEAWEYWVLSIN